MKRWMLQPVRRCQTGELTVLSECSETASCRVWGAVVEVRFLPLGHGSATAEPRQCRNALTLRLEGNGCV